MWEGWGMEGSVPHGCLQFESLGTLCPGHNSVNGSGIKSQIEWRWKMMGMEEIPRGERWS